MIPKTSPLLLNQPLVQGHRTKSQLFDVQIHPLVRSMAVALDRRAQKPWNLPFGSDRMGRSPNSLIQVWALLIPEGLVLFIQETSETEIEWTPSFPNLGLGKLLAGEQVDYRLAHNLRWGKGTAGHAPQARARIITSGWRKIPGPRGCTQSSRKREPVREAPRGEKKRG